MNEPILTTPRDGESWRQYELLAASSFNLASMDTAPLRPHTITCLAEDGGRVVGGLMAIRCDLNLGGRPVPAGAFAALCVAPEARGRKLGQRIFAQIEDDVSAEGRALGLLWTPATGIYRRWGWEVAGLGRQWKVPISALGKPSASPGHVERGFTGQVHELQRRLAGDWNCSLGRPEWWWRWKYPPTDPAAHLYRLSRDGHTVDAVVGYRQQPNQSWGYDLVVCDFWADGRAAERAALAFLAGHGSQVRSVLFDQAALPPTPGLLWELRQHDVREKSWYPWMLKVLDIPTAFSLRGWPRHLNAALAFEVHHTDGTTTCWSLRVQDGKGEISKTGRATVALDETTLAAWYAGALHVPRLRHVLDTSTSAHDIELMAGLTAGSGPWLPDVF